MKKFFKPWAVLVTMLFFGAIILVVQTHVPPPPLPQPDPGHCDTTSNGGVSDLLNRTVTLHGRFSTNGALGPFLDCMRLPVYLKPPAGTEDTYVWGVEYEQVSDRLVAITGMLRVQPAVAGSSEEKDQGYFYFEKWRIRADGEQPTDIVGP